MQRTSILVLVASVVACASSHDQETHEDQAVTSSDTCSAQQITDDRCDGSWDVQRDAICYANAQNPDCGVQYYNQCPVYNSCWIWTTPRYDHYESITIRSDFDYDCQFVAGHRTCRKVCTPTGNEQYDAAYAQQTAEQGTGYAVFGITAWSSTCTATASIAVYNAMTHAYGQYPQCGVAGYQNCNPVYNTCRTPANGYDDGHCGVDPTITPSAAGLTLAEIPAVAHQPIANATCETCDNIATDTTTGAQAKATCLLGRVGDSRTDVHAKVVHDAELLLETRGDALLEDQRTAILALYAQDASVTESCGDTTAFPSAGAGCGDMATIDSRLRACHRLTMPHASVAVVGALLDDCLAIGAQIDALDAGSCQGDDYRKLYDQAIVALGTRLLSDPVAAMPSQGELQRRLHLIDHYYQMRRGRFPAPAQRTQLDQEASTLAGAFWTGVQAYIVASLDGAIDAALSDALDGARATTMELDRQVVLAAFTVTPSGMVPLPSAPLLIVLADSLRAVSERATDIAAYHDAACRWRATACTPGDSPLSAWFSALGALDDAAGLTAALAQGGFAGDPWELAFDAIRDQHHALEMAIVDAGTGTTTLPIVAASDQPPSLTELAGMIAAARGRARSYATSGQFDPTAADMLHAGMDEANVQAVDDDFTADLGLLTGAVNDYATHLTDLIRSRLADVDAAGQEATADARVTAQAHRVFDLELQLAGLRASATATTTDLGNFAKNFDALAASSSIPSDLAVDREETSFDLGPWQARFTTATDRPTMTVDSLAADPLATGTAWKHAVGAGQTVTITADGSWTTTCAIQRTTKPDYAPSPTAPGVTFDFTHIDLADADTGPQGWRLDISGGAMHATSYRTDQGGETTTSDSHTTSNCLGAGAGFSDLVTLNAGSQYCENSSTGDSSHVGDESSETRGLDERTTLSTTGGLRLNNTPFPRLAAGSLILVETKPGSTRIADIIGAWVVQPHASMLIHQDGDLYLVVNDLSDPSCGIVDAPSTERLHLTFVVSTPFGAMAKQISAAMVGALNALETEATAQHYLDQDRLLPEQTVHLHDLANQQLEIACGTCNLALMPTAAKSLFDMYVNASITRLALSLEAESIQREIRSANLDAVTLGRDLDRTVAVGRMARMAAMWSLRNLDGEALRFATGAVNTLTLHQMYPLLHLRYPDRVADVQAAATTAITTLHDASWTASPIALANQVKDLANVVKSTVGNAMVTAPGTNTDVVVIRFPKPGTTVDPTPWRTADPARAQAVWDSLATGALDITLTPDDLYNSPGRSLACIQSLPIIRAMTVYEVVKGGPVGLDSQLNAWGYAPPITAGAQLDFAGRTAAETYLIPDTWRSHTVDLRFGTTVTAAVSDANLAALHVSTSPRGLSPLGRYSINVSQLLPPNNPAGSPFTFGTELDVMFELETRDTASPGLTWVGTCKPQG